MPKITFISGALPPIRCGVGYYAHSLLEKLSTQQTLDISVIATIGATATTAQPLITVPDWRLYRLPYLLKTLRKSNPDIIHIQYPSAPGYKRWLGINLLPYLIRLRLPRVKLVVTLHEFHESRLQGRVRNLLTVTPAHKIVVSNEVDKQSLPGRLSRKSEVIPISSSIKRAQADVATYKNLLERLGLDKERPTLLFFGFVFPNKRLEVLADALSEPGLAHYQALLLTGLDADDSYQKGLIVRFDSLNAEKRRVAWTGFLPDEEIAVLLPAGKYFVLPQSEPISAKSSTAITAVLNGLVLISAGSADSTVTLPFENGKNAYLAHPMDAQTLVRAITELDSSEALQDSIRRGTRELASYFSWDNIVNKHLELYESLKH